MMPEFPRELLLGMGGSAAMVLGAIVAYGILNPRPWGLLAVGILLVLSTGIGAWLWFHVVGVPGQD